MQIRMKFFVILVAIFAIAITASADVDLCQPAEVGNAGTCFTLEVEKEVGVPTLIFKVFGFRGGPRWFMEYTIRRADGKLDSNLALKQTELLSRVLKEELLTLDGSLSVDVKTDGDYPQVVVESRSWAWDQILIATANTIRNVVLPGGAIKEVRIR